MDVFDLRSRLVNDYASYTKSFINISDQRINEKVSGELEEGLLWPEPLLQLNPTFLPGATIDELVINKVLHSECAKIFRAGKNENDPVGNPMLLHAHQKDSIDLAKAGKSFVLTSGTGSGKSLAYIIPIVDHILRHGSNNGIKAIIVYPMNALANSQMDELSKFLHYGYSEDSRPVSFARYTGQEIGTQRKVIRDNPPDILLTNYMMLELLLTRAEDSNIVRNANSLKYLVFDELHTYRGRQGADIAMLIRRCQETFNHDKNNIIHIGTSATMSSGGPVRDQKKEVAKVAKLFFGVAFDEYQVIEETLERSTPEIDFKDDGNTNALKGNLEVDQGPPDNYEDMIKHPLSSWIESNFGVYTDPGSNKLVRQVPQKFRGLNSASEKLAILTGLASEQCYEALKKFFIKGTQIYKSASSRYPIFAFKLHQFFTRGDTVWATLEPEQTRYLDLNKLVSKPGEDKKILFPLVFCRHCGKEYYRVTINESKQLVIPREDGLNEDKDGDAIDGYLYISTKSPWPDVKDSEYMSRIPEPLKEVAADGYDIVKRNYRKDLPFNINIQAGGDYSGSGNGISATLIKNNFLFCLEPDCGVTYTRGRRSEKGKLSTLGVDNRSTATTILAVRSLIELQNDQLLDPEAQKLLSFTDNRQDASLQAGHFNDFSQVALLRSALYKATLAKKGGLKHDELADSVFKNLQLDFADYAADPDIKGPAVTTTNNALKEVIEYYLYRDLQRGWRITAPNLEECGMLEFDFEGLDGPGGLLSDKGLWEVGFDTQVERNVKKTVATPEVLKSCSKELREEILRELLDTFRRELAIKVNSLDPQKQREIVERTGPRLLEDSVWYIEDNRDLVKSVVIYPYPKKKTWDNYSISSYGIYGRYLRRALKPFVSNDDELKRENIDTIIEFLFLALKRYGIIEQVRSESGYQINHASIIWLAGSGKHRPLDKTRLLNEGQIPPVANEYFVQCYKGFVDLKCNLEAREHTAQVAGSERIVREERFRKGSEPGGLPLLFCSPTMELGVDIAQLNLVNLRNVPPTPANYAQRSGRAGRGGQPALVFTYCAGRSPHDQYYYRAPTQMVAGTVIPPRIDLRNRDLLRSHINAIWFEVAKPKLGSSLTTVLDLSSFEISKELPVNGEFKRLFSEPSLRSAALEKAGRVMNSIEEHITGTAWFHSDWVKETLQQIGRSFDESCNRWREMYRSASRQRDIHHNIIGDHSRSEQDRNHSKRLRMQAEEQIKLLTEAGGVFEGDFYTYRYFAAEGFLPGYNFPRLPLSAYVPARRGRRSRNEYISRPRFLAITEFGPQALVYHEGARYKVYKVNLDYSADDPNASHNLSTVIMKRCTSCGYAHIDEGVNLATNCVRCGANLDGDSVINDLVYLQNVSLKLNKRITCDDEERMRYGYRIRTAYEFPYRNNKLDRKDAEVCINETPVIKLNYGDATTLYRINAGWASQGEDQPPGFILDLERGYWASNPKDPDDAPLENGAKTKRVVPYVIDTKNAMIMEFIPALPKEMLVCIQAAFKEAIQKKYQLESKELATELLPKPDQPREIIFYEAAEGGAGILRQLVEDPKAISNIAEIALEICHFDSKTRQDLEADTCGRACYRCLLDYANQRVHPLLDRHLIKGKLIELTNAVCKTSGGTGSRADRIAAMKKKCDSNLEKKWLDKIDELMLIPPSEAQHQIAGLFVQPDFYYRETNTAVFIDGPPHDTLEQQTKDMENNGKLIEAGYLVVRFHHTADWEDKFKEHPDVFGEVQK